MGDIPRIDRGPGGAHLPAQRLGEVEDQLEVLFAAYAGSSGDYDGGALQITAQREHFPLQHLQIQVTSTELRGDRFHSARALGVRQTAAHDAFPHGGQLWVQLGVYDGGDDVATEGRPDLEQQIAVDPVPLPVLTELQVGAVGR